VSKRIGPSMSTEPGWMGVLDLLSYYFESKTDTAAKRPQHAVEF